MGFFGTYLFDGTSWTEQEPGYEPDVPEPWLLIHISDSDIAMVVYEPPSPGSGVAYLGFTPRTYFEDNAASAPTDADRKARGLAAWWAGQNPGADDVTRARKTRELRAFLAADGVQPNQADDADDADVFVEVKAARFLTVLGLPTPAGLT
jgi:hypothetical protein